MFKCEPSSIPQTTSKFYKKGIAPNQTSYLINETTGNIILINEHYWISTCK